MTTSYLNDNTARLWEVKTGKLLHILKGLKENSSNVDFSYDSKLIVSVADDNTARLWNVETGRLLHILKGHKSEINNATFSPNGKFVITSSDDTTARLWRVFKTQELINYANQIVQRCLINRKQFFLPESKSNILIKEGEILADQGKINRAIFKFNQAKKLAPCFKFNSKEKAIIISAISLINKGEKLAKKGKIDEAIFEFNTAIKMYSKIKMTNPIDYAQRLAQRTAQKLIESGKKLAQDESIEDAIVKFKEALSIDSNLDFIPKDKAQANLLLRQGTELAGKGKLEKAISKYQEAQKIDSKLEISAFQWSTLCWSGSLYGYAGKSIKYCEKAVKLVPNGWWFRDARALARALTGDIQGAIEDYRFAIRNNNDESKELKMQGWLDSLQKGENPFTEEVLEELRK